MALEDVRMLGEIAEYQWGMVTTAQAAEIGVSRLKMSQLNRAGVLERVDHGVYRIVGSAPEPHEEILAAWLAVSGGDFGTLSSDPDVVVAGVAASQLHGMGELVLSRIDLISASGKRSNRANVRMRRSPQISVVYVGESGVPTMTPALTIADLILEVGDLSLVGDALQDGRRIGIVDENELLEHLDRVAPVVKAKSGRELLEQLELSRLVA